MDLEGASPGTASPGISLTCGLLPTAAYGAGTGALPLGVALTPLAPLPDDLVLVRDALRCEQCGGFIGPHCEIVPGSWRCGLCGAENRSLTLATGPAHLKDAVLNNDKCAMHASSPKIEDQDLALVRL